ncbi:MAG TPA: HlyD family efflux transporter periplasmic adaptor subunit [Limnobacter sp.]|nr:HlyD family efflux transporter periplasmic adaptor subunit [Limnobacter sp.]
MTMKNQPTQAPLIEVEADLATHQRLRQISRLIVASSLAFVLLVMWANWAELEQVSRGAGQIIASSKTQIIQAPDGGVIEDLMVREGDQVVKGQTLAKLDHSRAEAAFREIESKRLGLLAQIDRLKAEALQQPLVFDPVLDAYPEITKSQASLFARRKQAINEEIGVLASALTLAEEELALNELLLKSQDVSVVDVIRLRRQVTDLKGQIINRKNRYFQESQAELTKAQEEFASISQTAKQRQTSLDYTTLTAPVSGVIKNVRLTTTGGVLKAGDELLTIVPSDEDLIIEAKIKPQEIAFIKTGLPANVKIDTYDYTVYGSLSGVVTYISADTLQEETRGNAETFYRVHVRTTGKQFSKFDDTALTLLPGMTASIEVKTGTSTVLDYLFKPIVKTLGSSLGER